MIRISEDIIGYFADVIQHHVLGLSQLPGTHKGEKLFVYLFKEKISLVEMTKASFRQKS